ncbi:MAG: hypothetical protein ABIU54_04890 [Candidatus Eisenbacteria bacterium]
MFRKSLVALALLAVLAPAAHAQTVEEILAKHYDAIGLDKLKKVQTMRVSGKMIFGPGMEAALTMERKRPGMSRMDFTLQGMTGVRAFDGDNGWSVMPFMGKKDPEAMSAEDSKEMKDDADFEGALVDWKAKGHTVEYVGKESVEGAETYKLKLTKKGGQVETYYLDTETGLILKQEAKRTVRGNEIDGETVLGDYKDVNGMLLPFSFEQGRKGSPQKQKMTFDKYEMDVKLEDARFKMPAVAAAADTSKAAAKGATKAAAKAAVKKGK